MTNQSDDPRLTALRDALDVDPSPAFVARVRQRVEMDRQSASSRTLVPRIVWAVAAVVAVVGITWVAVRRIERNAGVHLGTHLAAVAPVVTTAPAVETSVFPTPRPIPSGISRRGAETRAAVASGARASTDPEVLVPDDQGLALIRLLRDLREGRADVPASVSPVYDKDGLLLPPPPVVIQPLPDLIPKPPAGDKGKG